MIGDEIEIEIIECIGDVVKVGIRAPKEVRLLRKELFANVAETNRDALRNEWTAADLNSQLKELKNRQKS